MTKAKGDKVRENQKESKEITKETNRAKRKSKSDKEGERDTSTYYPTMMFQLIISMQRLYTRIIHNCW